MQNQSDHGEIHVEEPNNMLYGDRFCKGQLVWGKMNGWYPGKNLNKIT